MGAGWEDRGDLMTDSAGFPPREGFATVTHARPFSELQWEAP